MAELGLQCQANAPPTLLAGSKVGTFSGMGAVLGLSPHKRLYSRKTIVFRLDHSSCWQGQRTNQAISISVDKRSGNR